MCVWLKRVGKLEHNSSGGLALLAVSLEVRRLNRFYFEVSRTQVLEDSQTSILVVTLHEPREKAASQLVAIQDVNP